MARSRTRTPTSTLPVRLPPGAEESAAVDFVSSAWAHLKAIAAARTRQWAREATLRTLA